MYRPICIIFFSLLNYFFLLKNTFATHLLLFIYFLKLIWLIISVLKLGPARRVDPGPGRPGPGTGPGGDKNPLGNWPGETRSTRRVDPGPGPPGQLTIVRERRGGMAWERDEERWLWWIKLKIQGGGNWTQHNRSNCYS